MGWTRRRLADAGHRLCRGATTAPSSMESTLATVIQVTSSWGTMLAHRAHHHREHVHLALLGHGFDDRDVAGRV